MPTIVEQGVADIEIGTNRTRRLVTFRVKLPSNNSTEILFTPAQAAVVIADLKSALESLPPEPPAPIHPIPER